MKSIIFYIKLFFATLRLNKDYNEAHRLIREGRIKEKEDLIKSVARSWGKKTLDLTGSTIEVIGKENIPSGEGFLITPNHESMFDISAVLMAFDQNLSFVTKEENLKIPFVSKWLPLLDCIAIDRSSPKSAVKSLMKGVKMIKTGKSIVIFPEGTRTADGTLGEFKAGSFKIAQKASAKVLPVAIIGTMDIMKKGSFKISSSKVTVSILKPIDSTDISTNELASMTKELIENEKNKWRNK